MVTDKLSERSTLALVIRGGTRNAKTCAGDNDTSSRLPKDLGRTLRRTFRTTLWSYDSYASSGLQYPLFAGVRGKYGGANRSKNER